MTLIKLCGLKRECDIECANDLKPEYIGFMFFEKSKRYVSPEDAVKLKNMLDESIKSVGVFVNAPIDVVETVYSMGSIDLIQLHGQETDEYIEELRSKLPKGVQIIKAFRVDSAEDILVAEKSKADIILLDSGSGGTGVKFDWSFLKNIKKQYFLAGGLDCNNVTDAVKSTAPMGVDVSSGIETENFKDPAKMRLFVENVRNI